jgi:hypothetical protein
VLHVLVMNEYTEVPAQSICPSIKRNREDLKRSKASKVFCPCHEYDVMLYLHFRQYLMVSFSAPSWCHQSYFYICGMNIITFPGNHTICFSILIILASFRNCTDIY